jgi:hypothetical protein
MPAHDRGSTKLDAYLVRILAAVVRRAKEGELRVKVEDVDAIDEGCILVKDFDSTTGELIFRTGSRYNEVYKVLPEVPCQTKTTTILGSSPSPPATPMASPSPSESAGDPEEQIRRSRERLASTLKTNEELAQMEKQYLQRRVAAQVRQELKQRSTEQQGLFPNQQ